MQHVSLKCMCSIKLNLQLLSGSTDNNVCIWDLLTGDCENKYRFPSPILKIQFDPRNDLRFLVCPMRYAAVVVEVGGSHKCLPLDNDVSSTIYMPCSLTKFILDFIFREI